MELGAIFLLLIIIIGVAWFVAKPFTRRIYYSENSSQELSTLMAERERTLNALAELDFDNRIGKVPPEEYTTQRADLVLKGVEVLHRLDEISTAKHASVEMLVKPETEKQNSGQLPDEDIEELIAARRRARQQKTAGFCHACGKPIVLSDRFCPSCGQALDGN